MTNCRVNDCQKRLLVAQRDALVKALQAIAGWGTINLSAEHEHGLRDIIKSIADRAVAALETIKDERA